ncbi:hypothetical protein SLI_7585 [Streptomyces lividans 1326]|uniref:Uncharacterized protein n=1 Tax=Streptomyces lividans 1326 TaxID=1200984 RepID=A0A7U9DY26_STRLI|nr:hypothetical protein SLI_7585 [Streptomyces lividans 1326]
MFLRRPGVPDRTPGRAQEGDDRGHEQERQPVGGVRGGRTEEADRHTGERGPREPARLVHQGAHPDRGGHVLARDEVVAQQGARRAVDRGDDAGDGGQHHQGAHVEPVERHHERGHERDRSEQCLADRGGQFARPAVDGRAAEHTDQQRGRGLDGHRQTGRRGGAGDLQDQQVLHGELHPRTGVRDEVRDRPPAHAAVSQGPPRRPGRLGRRGGRGRRGGDGGRRHSAPLEGGSRDP